MEYDKENYCLEQIILKLEEEGFVQDVDFGFFNKKIQVNKCNYELKISLFQTNIFDLIIKDAKLDDNSRIIFICYMNLQKKLVEILINSSIAIMMYFKAITKENSEFSLDMDADIGDNEISLTGIGISLDLDKFEIPASVRFYNEFKFHFVFDEDFDNNVIWGVENKLESPAFIQPMKMNDILEGKLIKPIIS